MVGERGASINMHKGIPQIYGSQLSMNPETGVYRFHPIEDEANVNVRRAAVGLSPLEEYARMMGVEWKLPDAAIVGRQVKFDGKNP